ncbi:hypothetical protein BU17DRAFT_74818 [Hysterangium stoloniferum]|nr:hypothetical protein BU17DRAFT_74818 [Hysterangium stoloniferum]
MPPPVSSNGMISAPSTSGSGAGNSASNIAIAPMTPASILNLRKLSTGLVPSSIPSGSSAVSGGTNGDMKETAKKPNKGKAAVSTLPRGRRGSTAKPGFSPNLKPLLPGAQPPTPTSPLSLPTPSGPMGRPSKSSHKVAEQKRRDSLKTSFDELRLLLPPVALPEDEELLPGCMPPRGPPKGDADGPNRGVSKLALLRCGNAYIKELKDMVKRRDGEINKLRSEVKRVRELLGDAAGREGEVQVDLDCDVDEGRGVEAGIRLKMGSASGGDDEDD